MASRKTTKAAKRVQGPSLPAGVRVTIARDGGGPTISLSDVPPSEVHAVMDWLEAVWKQRRVPVPYHTDTVPGSACATSTVDDGDWGDRRRRTGFEV